MLKICGFIVDKRNLFFLLFGILIIFSAVSRNWVNVENSMSHYLPDSTETKQGLDLMEQEFITYGTCDVMVANVSYEQAESIEKKLEFIPGGKYSTSTIGRQFHAWRVLYIPLKLYKIRRKLYLCVRDSES